jgi:hypothetical protein
MATGECKSANKSNTMFFTSPQKYMIHMHINLKPEIISAWEEKKNARLREISREVKKPSASSVSVR